MTFIIFSLYLYFYQYFLFNILQSTHYQNPFHWRTSLMAFYFNYTDYCSLRILAYIFLSNSKYWFNSDCSGWSRGHLDFCTTSFNDPFYYDYWSVFNLYKSSSSSNKQLVSHWSYLLTFKSPHLNLVPYHNSWHLSFKVFLWLKYCFWYPKQKLNLFSLLKRWF